MNPVNSFNVGAGAMLTGATPQGALQNVQNNQFTRHIIQVLHSQGPFAGWRAEVPIQERAGKVSQMITSLRLIQPRIEIHNAVQAALSFEEKAFREANQKDDYEKECATKLHHIKETRLRQQAVYNQGGLAQHGGGIPGAGRPNQVPPQFTPQMSRPMQTSPTPGQIPMHMGLNDPNVIQQQQRQQQQAIAQNQMGQQRLIPGMPMMDELSMLNQGEFDHISRAAAALLEKMSPEDMEKRRLVATRNMSAETKQMISQKYGDPLTWMMRVQILRTMKTRRSQQQQQQMARAQGLDPNAAIVGGDSMLNSTQRQMTPNMIGLQRSSSLPQQGLDPSSFIGNVENIQGQQADGLRSQEAGQLVVPASNAPLSSQQPFANPNGLLQPGSLQQNQPNVNRAVNPQQFLTQQQQIQQQQERLQTPQFATQNQVPNQSQAQARAQAAHNAKMAMTSQAGVQNTSQLNQSIPPQQSPAMSMLNRPVGPNMSPAQAAAQGRQAARKPGVNGQQTNNQQQAMRAQIPPNLPPAFQERLAQMTPEQLNSFLITQQRRALANNQAARNANGQPLPMQTSMSQPSQNGSFNDPNIRTSMALSQSLNGMAGAAQNNPMLPGQQQLLLQQQQQQQQLLRQQQQLIRSQNNPNIDMSPEQVREMDRMPFPPSMINSSANMNPPIPKTVKTWAQLKTWVGQNPQVLGNVDLPKLLDLQRLHFVHSVSQQREAGRNNEQPGQQNWGAGNAAQPFMPGQNVAGGRALPTMPAGPPVTANDIHIARQKIGPQSQNWSDEQIKALILKNRHRMLMQQLQARGLTAQQLNQKPAQATPVPTPTPTKQMIPPVPQLLQQQQTSQPTSVKAQPAPTGGKNTKSGAAGKATSKKRPHSDEVIEIQNPKAQPPSQAPPQPPTTSATTRPSLSSFTKEQLAALPPQQRAQLDAQMKRQSRPPLSRAMTEENWNNNLPSQLKQWYNEMAKANSPIINMSAEDKATMAKRLRESTDMLSRMDTLVQWLIKAPNQEAIIKALLSMRIQLMKQFKPTDWSVNDEFTIAADYLDKSLSTIQSVFNKMIRGVQSQKPRVPQAGAQSHVPPLNASNLQQLEEESKRARRTQNQNTVTAPVATQPPFPLGDPSPQGVPQAYGPGGFSPDKLKIPPTKRRKQSHPSISSTQGAPSKAASKTDATKPVAFKCTVADCEYHVKGFPTKVALDKHIEDEHKAKEEITDPLKYALESFDAALGVPALDKEESEKAKKSIISDASLVKHEVKTEGITPAVNDARLASQSDVKPMSPSSKAAKTTKATATAKQTKIDAKQEAIKAIEQPSVADDAIMKDSWVDSQIPLDLIQDTFDIPMTNDYPGFGGEFFDEIINSDMLVISQNEDTPDSIESNGFVTQTPNDGEMAKDDSTVQIKNVEDDNSWPLDWFSHPGPMMSISENDDPWMEWEAVNKELEAVPLDQGLMFSVS